MKYLFEELQEMSMSQVQSLDQRLDALFSRLGIDVVFSKHFIERLAGREDAIEPEEIYEAFAKFLRKYGADVYMSKELSGVLKDLSDDINASPPVIRISRSCESSSKYLISRVSFSSQVSRGCNLSRLKFRCPL